MLAVKCECNGLIELEIDAFSSTHRGQRTYRVGIVHDPRRSTVPIVGHNSAISEVLRVRCGAPAECIGPEDCSNKSARAFELKRMTHYAGGRCPPR